MSAFAAAARRYMGTPWQHQGRNRHGFDCPGLLVLAAADCGCDLSEFDSADYVREARNGMLRKRIERALGSPIPEPEWAEGCVVMLNTHREPHHLAILTRHPEGGWSLLHTGAGKPFVREHRLSDDWARRIVAVYRSPV